jgi:hypothetical protein
MFASYDTRYTCVKLVVDVRIYGTMCTLCMCSNTCMPNVKLASYFLEKYGPRTDVAAWGQDPIISPILRRHRHDAASNSVEIDQEYRLLSTQIIRCWEKLQSVILEQRPRELDLRIYSFFETLYHAIKKCEQAPSKLAIYLHVLSNYCTEYNRLYREN